MPNLNVTYQDMHDAAGKLTTGKQEIEHKLHELKSLVDNLVNGGYVTDKSSKAFDHCYTEFNDGVTKTIDGLDGISDYLNKAAQALQDTDNQLASAIQK
ncbi:MULTISPECIES: WXG100 family type VII secretion target [unclassified Frankia]|uniref:WXG100 family type VII secretion target n=1 Tax=unclassified Frankia TaxID=2632575 RepID=UPI001EF6F45F|nr:MULTISPECIES: WXG100 family type VII secretion target [unclassified Frankia]